MDLEKRILEVLSRYASLERKTLVSLALAGAYNDQAAQALDATLLRMKAAGVLLAPSGLHGRWLRAQAAPRPEIRRNEPATRARGVGRRA